MSINEINGELDFLYRIHTEETPNLVEIPSGYDSYTIDLNTREINSPKILSVRKDHMSSVIYFNVDRYFDYMDLSTTSCVIIYKTPNGQSHFYPVRHYDIFTLGKQGKMIIPWNISDVVTEKDGTITYSFKFFKIEGDTLDSAKIIYNLNTAPAYSTVLYGLDAPDISLDLKEEEKINDIVTKF